MAGPTKAPPSKETRASPKARASRISLPVDPDADPRDARRDEGLDEVRVRTVLRPANRLLRARVEHVEEVEGGHQSDGSHLDRTIDVEVEVLIVRQTDVADVG